MLRVRFITSYSDWTFFLSRLISNSSASHTVSPTAIRDALLHQIVEQDIFLIVAMQGDGIAPKEMTKEPLLAEIQHGANDLNEDKDRVPYVHDNDGH